MGAQNILRNQNDSGGCLYDYLVPEHLAVTTL